VTDGQEAVVLKQIDNRQRLFTLDARVSAANRDITKTGLSGVHRTASLRSLLPC